nr:hypothetical protein [uncultured bacterium]
MIVPSPMTILVAAQIIDELAPTRSASLISAPGAIVANRHLPPSARGLAIPVLQRETSSPSEIVLPEVRLIPGLPIHTNPLPTERPLSFRITPQNGERKVSIYFFNKRNNCMSSGNSLTL